jgi:hypothetical protein
LKFQGETDATPLAGRAVIDYFASEMPNQSEYVDDGGRLALEDKYTDFSAQVADYEDYYFLMLETDLGPYFRLLYHAFRHIEKSELSEEEKQRYAKIVRAHLSSSELTLLFFNCHSSFGEGFKAWIEKYELLKHIRPDVRARNIWMDQNLSERAFAVPSL